MQRVQGPPNAKIMIVGDCPYGVDERNGRYFQGYAGDVLDKLLREAGIDRSQCLLTTIAKAKPPGDNLEFFFEDKKFFKPKEYWKECLNEFSWLLNQYRPNIIIALGAVSMYYLTGNRGINGFRGYITDCTLCPGIKVLPIIHPATINADWKLYFYTVLDVRKAIRNSVTSGFPEDKRVLEVNPSVSTFIEYCDWLIHEHKDPIALDIETMSGAHIDIIGLANCSTHAVSMNFMNFDGVSERTPRFETQIETKLWSKLAEVIETKELIMQNGTYDSGVLWERNRIWCRNYSRDIMIAAHAVWPECPRSLGFLASICLNVPPWKHTAQESPGLYNAADAANTYGIWNVLEKEMEKGGHRATHDFEMAQAEVAVMMQLQGMKIDREVQAQLSKDHHKAMNEAKARIDELIGREINFNSPKQVNTLLYEELALPKQYKRRKGKGEATLTADSNALAVLLRLRPDLEVLKLIAEYKKESKLLTFIDCEISPEGTVHTCYNITGANMAHADNSGSVSDDEDSYRSFGRWSSSGSIIKPYGSGNLQNIPPEARKMYYAGDGKTFLQADYKQAEAVVVAYLIGDEKLKKLFKASFGLSDEECKARNLDIHKITAATMLGLGVQFIETEIGLSVVFGSEVTGDQRKVGKTIRHAKNYSAGPTVLANKLGIGLGPAKQLMSSYDAGNPELGRWQRNEIQNELKQSRTLTNLFGRKHRFLDRWGDDLFRSAYSFIPQSSVGDLLNRALIILYNEFAEEVEIRIQLHDAIYIVVDDNPEAIERGKWILRHCMVERVQPLLVPKTGEEFFIDIDFKTGKYWGDLHD